MSNGSEIEWLEHAEADLRYAELGHKETGILLNLVAFHAQQAIEKSLKALLVARHIEFPRTHDLARLLILVKQAGFHCPAALDSIKELTPMAVQARYPGFDDPIEPHEIDAALRLAYETIQWVKGELAS